MKKMYIADKIIFSKEIINYRINFREKNITVALTVKFK